MIDDDNDDELMIMMFGDDNADENVTIRTFSLSDLLPSNKSAYFRYNGSLTTPPCYQSVIWTVFKQPVTISASQVITQTHFYRNFSRKPELAGCGLISI